MRLLLSDPPPEVEWEREAEKPFLCRLRRQAKREEAAQSKGRGGRPLLLKLKKVDPKSAD